MRKSRFDYQRYERNAMMAKQFERIFKRKPDTELEDKAPVLTICKRAVETSKSDLSEQELTKLITEYALADRRDGETVEKCFSRVVCALTPEGLMLRKALQISKGNGSRSGDQPVGATDADDDEYADDEDRDDDQDDDGDEDHDPAMVELRSKANALLKREPTLTPEQCFAKVYQDPTNRALVRAERKRNGYLFR